MSRVADIHTGARVECRDGVLGTVQRLERDDDGTPLHVRVREEDSSRVVIIPLGLVREIGDDGTLRLQTTCAEARGFTPGLRAPGASERRDARGPDTERIETRRAETGDRTLALHREDLVARVEPRELGTLVVRTEVEEVPATVEVEGEREEIELEHIAVNELVAEKVAPWYEDGELVVPVYEERLVVSKQLVLKEKLRVRRISVVERQSFSDTLRRERIIVDDPDATGAVKERQGDRAADAIRGLLHRWFSRERESDADEKRSA
jgi:uncharacterized protein (TIGR02271 family)